jgi:acetyl-CoA carboxylase biotin carboxyl carrier protein
MSDDRTPPPADLVPIAADPAPLPAEDPAVDPAALPAADAAAPPAADPAALPAADASLLALVDRLAALLERSDLTELEVEAGGTGIILRKAAAPGPSAPASASATPEAAAAGLASTRAAAGPSGVAPADAPAPSSARASVLAPLTGIFYASPTPGSQPFVEVGREVVVGQVIGLIEAMKLFNEIKSDKAGRVVRVVPENGALVKAKHPLIEVEPL